MKRIVLLILCLAVALAGVAQSTKEARWRAATQEELEAVLPARAPVEKEHIETEMRTANGVINDRKQIIAAVVLITAGYAADGKYSHFLLVQSPLSLDNGITLQPGSYVVGWHRSQDGLEVNFFDSATGLESGTVVARPKTEGSRVESFRIWPPRDHKGIQIGRFFVQYSLP